LTKKYGKNRVGKIISFGIFNVKMAIRDVAPILNIGIDDTNMILDEIQDNDGDALKNALDIIEQHPDYRDLSVIPCIHDLFIFAQKIEGLHRNISVHACGIVIGKTDLTDYAPLYRDPRTGDITVQYTKDNIEYCGLMVFDILGLKTLDITKNTEKEIRNRDRKYITFSIETIPLNDPETFKLLGKGNNEGVFMFDSRGMQKVLRDTLPATIDDLMVLNALYRPGPPLEHLSQFISRKHGKERVEYPNPCLEDILKETYGIIVYQEQVMLIIQKISGYSLVQAYLLLRLMYRGKTIPETEKQHFVAASAINGFSENDSGQTFDLLVVHGSYVFNKSHAAACSIMAYQTAYLKANFPEEFKNSCQMFRY
jgi:DNA polymerase-3 subunit alpha